MTDDKIMICKKCKSSDIEYWDNALMCESFNWGYYCNGCGAGLDPDSDVEYVEEVNEKEHKQM
jgi:hypothetical protein